MSKPVRKQYNFASVGVIKQEPVEQPTGRKVVPPAVVVREVERTKQHKKKRREEEDSSEEEEEGDDIDASSAEEENDPDNHRDDSDVESGESEADQQQLEKEEGAKLSLKRLPELMFVLNFAHKRARELLKSSDEDDAALSAVVATWLGEVGERFDTFEKQAQKFDNFENALLQSQRMHSKLRGQIAASLKLERDHKRILHESTVAKQRRKKAAQEAKKSALLLKMLGGEEI